MNAFWNEIHSENEATANIVTTNGYLFNIEITTITTIFAKGSKLEMPTQMEYPKEMK